MIAKVRIAPVERWCPMVLDGLSEKEASVAGREVEIRTETMRSDVSFPGCDGKRWMLTQESQAQIDELIGFTCYQGPAFWCEHMLEMD
jgi:hypothetical protein